jgi:hypothetical protein
MTEEIIQSLSLNKILVALLEEHGSLSVKTDRLVNAVNEDKELVIDYDDQNLTFKFSLRNQNEQ